jgi:putative phosphotransacetylase
MDYLPGIGREQACQGCQACSIRAEGGAAEEALIRRVVTRVLQEKQEPGAPAPIPVGVSVRHVHVRADDLATLYGPGYRLKKLRDLYQPGEFAGQEVVAVVGPRMRSIQNVRVLGPARDVTQVELSRTDGILLGLDLPVRRSGDLQDACPIVLVGPAGSLHLKAGAIRANRHIHMPQEEADRRGLKDGQLVRVRVRGDMGLVFDNVMVRVKPGFRLQMHLDTDDANAADLTCSDSVEIVN